MTETFWIIERRAGENSQWRDHSYGRYTEEKARELLTRWQDEETDYRQKWPNTRRALTFRLVKVTREIEEERHEG